MEKQTESKTERISFALNRDLKSIEQKHKYLEILDKRMDENRKTIGSLFLILVLCAFAFQLLLQAKISEMNVGPFKINDGQIAQLIIPTVFAFVHYKYLMIWYDFVEQKNVYKILTSLIFEVTQDSYINDRIRPFSIIDSVMKYHSQDNLNLTGCISYLLWIPISILIIIFPFAYQFFMIYELYYQIRPPYEFNVVLIITPILIVIFTILMFIKVVERGLAEKY